MKIEATGMFTWDRVERVSDRYGSFNLFEAKVPDQREIGLARVTATVLETRESEHIGDLFRGIFPSTPDVGETIDLGTALVTVSLTEEGAPRFTMAPIEERDTDWIDPTKLYRLHSQTVRVEIESVQS